MLAHITGTAEDSEFKPRVASDGKPLLDEAKAAAELEFLSDGWASCLAGTAYRVSGAPWGEAVTLGECGCNDKIEKTLCLAKHFNLVGSRFTQAKRAKPGLARDFFCHGRDSNPWSNRYKEAREKIIYINNLRSFCSVISLFESVISFLQLSNMRQRAKACSVISLFDLGNEG